MSRLDALGFPTSPYWQRVSGLEGILDFWREWQEQRDQLPFEIDGVVVKVNRLADQRRLGMTARAPRWAMAFKFSARQAATVLNGILLQMGRTGTITPVADLAPAPLGGVTIRRATLHNFEEIKRLDVRPGDTVLLERGGDVIPKVVGVDLSLRPPNAKPYRVPTRCPFCNAKLERVEGEVALRCPNPEDPEVVKRQIEHFASRDGLDIEGLGSETVDMLVDTGQVKDVGDLFFLTFDQLVQLDRFAKKSAENLLANIERAKRQVAGPPDFRPRHPLCGRRHGADARHAHRLARCPGPRDGRRAAGRSRRRSPRGPRDRRVFPTRRRQSACWANCAAPVWPSNP